MKAKKILKIFLFIFVCSCNNIENQQDIDFVRISENVRYQEKKDEILLKSGQFDYQIKKNKLPFKKIVVLNTSLLGYLIELGQIDNIIGVAGAEYIYSEEISRKIDLGEIQNVGTYNKYNIEKIIALNPDVIFTNYISSFDNIYNVLKNNGIQVIFLDEYQEQNPLEKTAYLLIFGKLLGVEKSAEKIYKKIEQNYHQFKKISQKSEKNPKVLVNEMYGNHWFMPGGKTFVANYLRDAKSDYILKDNEDIKAIPMSFEEVFAKSQQADFWLNVGDYQSKKDLQGMNNSYEKINAFRNGKIYNITKRKKGDANDYFESGSVRADWILRDYIKILHPELLPKDTLVYMKELK